MLTGPRNCQHEPATAHRSALGKLFQSKVFVWLASVLPRLELDRHTAILAFKTSIPPTVLVCAIESDTWSGYFKTNAYLAPIIAACALPTLPRARLVQYNVQLTFSLVLSYCWALLAGWSGVQARKHTASDLNAYNSSAEAVVAIFLIVWIWCSFTLKSAYAAWGMQSTLAGIFAVALMPLVARAPTMQHVMDDARITLQTFLVGQATGLVTGLLIFPQSSRGTFRKNVHASLNSLHAVMVAQKRCIDDLMAKRISVESRVSSVRRLHDVVQTFVASVANTHGEVPFAAREVSWGRLDAAQLEKTATLLAGLVAPVAGFSAIADMLQLAVERAGDHGEINAGSDWHSLEASMYDSWLGLHDSVIQGLEHAKIRLGRAKKPDEESGAAAPGDATFVDHFQHCFDHDDTSSQEELLANYVAHKPQADQIPITPSRYADTLHYLQWLHAHTLISSLGHELSSFLLFIEDTHTRPKRLLIPRVGHLAYWLDVFVQLGGRHEDGATDDTSVELGEALSKPKDPDHLPPTNFTEKAGDAIRKICSVFRSPHAAYGLRGACAVMTIVIISFLRASQDFYFEQRFLWALFAILLSMGRTAGSSTFMLLCRVLGTVVSMTVSYVIWYMVDGKTAGVLVFLWLWFAVIGYFLAKFPRFTSMWFVVLVAAIVMISDPLQIRKLGKATVAAAGQAVYPPYITFPYRLATVSLGVLTGYIWTVFPYPLSEYSELRETVAQEMNLLARYNKSTAQIVLLGLYGAQGDSPSRLQLAHRRNYRKVQALSVTAKAYLHFQDWEFTLGGRFPKDAYGEIISIIDRLGSYMTVTGYVSRGLTPSTSLANTTASHLTPDGVATRLIVLHSALGRAHPLPPELVDLKITDLAEFLASSVSEDRFASVALIRSVNWHMIRDVNRLTVLVRDLVGEMDFTIPLRAEATSSDCLS